MKFEIKIKIDTSNAAFEDNGVEAEIARILRRLADKAESSTEYLDGTSLMDSNGNTVGNCECDLILQ